MKTSRCLVVVAIAVGLSLLSGCASPDSGASTAVAPSAAMDRTPDASIAATCAALSSIDSITLNAEAERAAGVLSEEGYVRVVNSTVPAFESIRLAPKDQRGLRAELAELLALIDASDPTKLSYDPTSAAYLAIRDTIARACKQNTTEDFVVGVHGG
ncbi:hypothetical protein [Agromyces soli]|uniref:Lipoprotein n=1 Tax=Agromyces soli TaxID=659012 RepID=A0ABY4AWU4_9MICO|nr:hypothetical protein [Agromyces soli]UOE26581.1 hypothetical protein MTP13_02015 [Agromyces soli]